jgi:hypothetical protein
MNSNSGNGAISAYQCMEVAWASHLPQQHAEGVHITGTAGGPTLQRLRRQVRSLHSYQAHCFHLCLRLCRNTGPSAKYCVSAATSAAMLQTLHHTLDWQANCHKPAWLTFDQAACALLPPNTM